jgi:hypothetical protein
MISGAPAALASSNTPTPHASSEHVVNAVCKDLRLA